MPTHGVLVGREHLLDVALGDDVAHRGAPVAGHHHAAGEGRRDDRRAVRRVDRSARRRRRVRRPGSSSGATAARKSTNDELPGAEERGRRAGRHVASASRSLAALLDEAADELLGVLLEHVVDLVEDRVDVVVELRLALRDVALGLGSASSDALALTSGWPCAGRPRSRVAIGRPPLPSGPCRAALDLPVPIAGTAARRPDRRDASATPRAASSSAASAAVSSSPTCALVPRSGSRSAPAAASPARQVEDHRVPGGRGDVGARTAPALGRGSTPGCPPAGSVTARSTSSSVSSRFIRPRATSGCRGPSSGRRRRTAGRSGAAAATSQSEAVALAGSPPELAAWRPSRARRPAASGRSRSRSSTDLPAGEHVRGLRVDVAAERSSTYLRACSQVLHLELDRGQRAAVAQRDRCVSDGSWRDLVQRARPAGRRRGRRSRKPSSIIASTSAVVPSLR